MQIELAGEEACLQEGKKQEKPEENNLCTLAAKCDFLIVFE